MLRVNLPGQEFWDENRQCFYAVKGCTLNLEHSLLSISKWEAKWKKPFLSNNPKTQEETLDYIRCMTMNTNVDPMVYASLTPAHIKTINDYIGDPMTASSVEKRKTSAKSGSMVTSELIYYWMTAFQIPFECQKWHLNRLLMLIQICQAKNQTDSKKMPKKDMAKYNRSLNAARRAKLHSKG